MANMDVVDNRKVNKAILIIAWSAAVLASIPRYIDTKSMTEVAFLLGIFSGTFILPTVIYFVKKDSNILKYFINIAAFIAILAVVYQQKGAIGGVFLLCIPIIVTIMYLDSYLTIFSTVVGITLTMTAYLINKPAFFPLLNIADTIELCVGFAVSGMILNYQDKRGRQAIIESRQKEEEQRELNGKLVKVFDDVAYTSDTLDKNIIKLSDDTRITKEKINLITQSIQQTSKAAEQQASSANESIQSLNTIENIIDALASNSKSMTESSVSTHSFAMEGKEVINELVNQMHVVDDAVKIASSIITDLNSQSNQINKIAYLCI
jgi:methyl-accepting chemotaxis protein